MENKNSGYSQIIFPHSFISAIFTLILLSLVSMPVISDHNPAHTLHKQPIVDAIIIRGLQRTKKSVVRRELLFSENSTLTTTLLLESIQRLKNLQIFSKVIPLLELKSNNHVDVIIELEGKWTTIPYFGYSEGGNTTYYYAGIYDINSFGKYIETGAQYDNWNGKSGALAWFRNPRFLNKRILFGADIWSTTKPRNLYDTDGEKQGEFAIRKQKISFILKNEYIKWFKIGWKLDVIRDRRLSAESSTDSNQDVDKTNLQLANIPESQDEVSNTLSIHFGKLNYDNYLVRGKTSELFFKYADTRLGSDKKIKLIRWQNKMFWRLPYKANVGIRFKTANVKSPDIQDYFYIGGFTDIRGYLDGQFRNKAYWQLNTEYRIPSLQTRWLVLQHIFFVDIANTANRYRNLSVTQNNIYSAGIGIRIISPRIYSFNGRIDIALLSSQKSTGFLSFGAQQFF